MFRANRFLKDLGHKSSHWTETKAARNWSEVCMPTDRESGFKSYYILANALSTEGSGCGANHSSICSLQESWVKTGFEYDRAYHIKIEIVITYIKSFLLASSRSGEVTMMANCLRSCVIAVSWRSMSHVVPRAKGFAAREGERQVGMVVVWEERSSHWAAIIKSFEQRLEEPFYDRVTVTWEL